MRQDKLTLNQLNEWGVALGFQQVSVTDTRLEFAEQYLAQWLDKGYHGDMTWMQHHGSKRTRPAELYENTLSIISVRMDYFPPQTAAPELVLNHPELAYISRYALGRDYHKVLRKRLQKLIEKIREFITSSKQDYRVFVDSAPVMEKPLAVKSGLGWMGKHTNVLNQHAGSLFFLGEIYTTLPVETFSDDKPPQTSSNHCGDCTACIDVCPTQAIVAPYELDARRCISYLTIEHKGHIPVEFREAMGNRIYGCDDCQLICPWNRFAQQSTLADFAVRHSLDAVRLLEVFAWTEDEFLRRFEGSAIRRIGYERWIRNIAVALGNAPSSMQIINALQQKRPQVSALVAEHIDWALERQKRTI